METKDSIQSKARKAFAEANHWGLAAIATGVGKSKIGVDESAAVREINPKGIIVIVVPTRDLRDNNWKKEFEEWGHSDIYNSKQFAILCYQSIHKLINTKVSLLILDEGHHLTAASSEVFKRNQIARCLVLSATPPNAYGNDTDKEKARLFSKFKLSVFFKYTLDEAVRDGLAAPYEVRIVECELDDQVKYIKAGSKVKGYFYQTEAQKYKSLNHMILMGQMKGDPGLTEMFINKRMIFIKSLASKTEIAKRLIAKWVDVGDRYIIFCGSIAQADLLGGKSVHHSKAKKNSALQAFKDEEINHLYVVDGINEGTDIRNVNGAVAIQLNSRYRDIVQRLGRVIRARPGHKAIFWVLMVKGTVDEEWCKESLKVLDQTRVVRINYKSVIYE